MNDERKDLLNLTILPARLNGEETARFLGFKPHDIPVLLKAGLLKPLGKPLPNGDKYFATVVLTELRQNVSWLSKATLVVSQHWKERNAGKTNGVGSGHAPLGNGAVLAV